MRDYRVHWVSLKCGAVAISGAIVLLLPFDATLLHHMCGSFDSNIFIISLAIPILCILR